MDAIGHAPLPTFRIEGPDDGKHLLRQLIPSLKVNAAAYDASATILNSGTGDSCELTIAGFKKQLMSVWFISHSLGFIGKVWIFRSVYSPQQQHARARRARRARRFCRDCPSYLSVSGLP